MKLAILLLLATTAICRSSILTYEFYAHSQADLDTAREDLAIIAVPRLLHCAQFGLFGNTDGSPREKKIALSILRKRGDFKEWFREQFRPHVQPGFEYRDTPHGVRMKFIHFPGLNRMDANQANYELFRLLEIIGTYESLMIALEYSEDDRHIIEPSDDIISSSIGEMAMHCMGVIVRRLGIDDSPATSDYRIWRDWIVENNRKLQESSQRKANEE